MQHILLTHSGGSAWGPEVDLCSVGTVEKAKEIVEMGAYIEVALHQFVGASAIWPITVPTVTTDWLKAMGPKNIVMSQKHHEKSPD